MTDKIYKVCYFVDQWNKPINTKDMTKVASGIQISDNNLGYADTVFVASVIRNEDNSIQTILLLDSDSRNGQPSKDLLFAIRDAIDHRLEYHTDA